MYFLNLLLYYLVIIPVSLLPYPILYFISDGIYVLVYKVFGYRKKVVIRNIDNSFPQLSEAERKVIVEKFYRHFADLIVESLKTFTISKKNVDERMVADDVQDAHEAFKKHKSVILAGGHLNNWELFAVAIDDAIPHETIGIYAPLNNEFFDKKMRETRSKYGLTMISTKKIGKYLADAQDRLTAPIFGMDQAPSNPHKSIWMEFLNQDTSVSFGAEKFAKMYNYPVFYGRIKKKKRGYYSFDIVEICSDPSTTPHGYITELVTKMLEKDILENPEYWLWSHKRWKRQRPADYKFDLTQ